MGYRTVVILFNDQAHEWTNDPELGKKIAGGMHYVNDGYDLRVNPANFGTGRVVECTHADTETLAVLDSYEFTPLTHTAWTRGQSTKVRDLKLIRAAADRLGYRLTKKPGEVVIVGTNQDGHDI